jgi:sec-independent protein translocase protein TatA
VALLVFGPRRLPEIGCSLGKGMREFKDSITGKDEKRELPALTWTTVRRRAGRRGACRHEPGAWRPARAVRYAASRTLMARFAGIGDSNRVASVASRPLAPTTR